jgi:hypothetical protein
MVQMPMTILKRAPTSSAGSLLIFSKTLRGAGVVDLRQERFS